MLDFAITSIVVIVGALFLASVLRRFDESERPFIVAGFAAHIIAAIFQVLITRYFYGGGDLLNFYRTGQQLSEWLSADFGRHALTLLELLFHKQEVYIPIRVVGKGGSTGSMFALSGFLNFFLGGSLYAICTLLSLFAFVGQLAIYLGLRSTFLPKFREKLLIACLLIPSAVFWSGGLLKETLAVGGLGLVFWGLQRLITRDFRARYLVVAAIGVAVVALYKAYILFPFFIAGAVWYYWHRSLRRTGEVAIISKPLYLFVGIAIAVGAVVGFGEIFPQYAPENLADELVTTQQYHQQLSGGSTYEMAVPEERSLPAQLALVPIALTSALLRPFLFEAHNTVSLVNALETTAILGFWIWIIVSRGLRDAYRTATRSPAVMFCLVFVVLFGTAVGLAAPNLGSLSRYRIPMMPFYVTVLLLLIPSGDS